jgi:hypothetical protein
MAIPQTAQLRRLISIVDIAQINMSQILERQAHLLLVSEAPVEHVHKVLSQVLPAGGLGDHRHATLHVPLEQHLQHQ